MTVIHKPCNSEVKSSTEEAIRRGISPGDFGFCQKCGKAIYILLYGSGVEIYQNPEIEVLS